MPVVIIEIPADLSQPEQQLVAAQARRAVREWLERRDARKARIAKENAYEAGADVQSARLWRKSQ